MTKGPRLRLAAGGPSYIHVMRAYVHVMRASARAPRGHFVLSASAIFVSRSKEAEPATTVVEPVFSRTRAS